MSGAPTLHALTGREASIFACLVDTLVAPGPGDTPVARTDAAHAFDRFLMVAPALNRWALRGALLVLEVAPRLLGWHARLRRLAPADRQAFIGRAEHHPATAGAVQAMQGIAALCYYGDRGVARAHGYDPEAVLERAHAARSAGDRW